MSGSTPPQSNKQHIQIFDTTLRDGEQAPGFSMSVGHKLEMAHHLAALRVDIIEAGFAAASPGDMEAVQHVAEEIKGPTICSLSRATERDIEAAAKALENANRSRLHIFLATSPIHRKAKLDMSCAEVLKAIETSLSFARPYFDQLEFSAEDALRTEDDFLVEAMQCAAEFGADVLNVPDTVGVSEPDEIYKVFKNLNANVKRSDHVIFSTHCHNDLGMAVSNSLAAVKAGAQQVECTINGIGERAGNCSLEEVVMALNVRKDIYGQDSQIDTTHLWPASQSLIRLTGTHLAPNKAIVGKNAFAHEAGIHQHGMMADRRTYEIMVPESVGAPASELILGKHSGKHALQERLSQLGYTIEKNDLDNIFKGFKDLADEHGEATDADLVALVEGYSSSGTAWSVVRTELRTTAGPKPKQFARVELSHPDRGRVSDIASGDGPVAAAFAAVKRIVGRQADVLALETRMVLHDSDREFVAKVDIDLDGQIVQGRARGPDIVTAAIDAFLFALDRNQTDGATVQTKSKAHALHAH